jgi:ribosomal protein S1
VDLGGIDGLIHVSEVSHARVKDPGQALSVGQTVKVEVVKVEDLGGAKERISLSRKKFAPDPWSDIEEAITPGSQIKGKVVRIVDFGAFVEIQPGVDGLVHVSALAEGRVEHPSKVVTVGEEVEAWVVNVNPENRRISLSLVDPALHPSQEERFERSGGPRSSGGGDRRPRKGRQGGRDSRDSRESGALREYREAVRSSDTGMTSMEEAFQRLREKQ